MFRFDALKSGYYHLQSKDTRKSVGPTSFVRGHLSTILEALHTLNGNCRFCFCFLLLFFCLAKYCQLLLNPLSVSIIWKLVVYFARKTNQMPEKIYSLSKETIEVEIFFIINFKDYLEKGECFI